MATARTSQRKTGIQLSVSLLTSRGRLSSVAGLLAIPACVAVDPAADFGRTQDVVIQRTGATDAYDPAIEHQIEHRVQALLADGLSIDEATSIALLNNKRLQSLFQEIGIARADVIQSGLLTNPTFSFGVRFPEGGGRSELTAGLAQQIVDLWQIPVRKRIAQSQLDQVILQLARQAQDLAATVHRHYYTLLAAERAIELTREHLSLAERSLEVAQTRVDVGEAEPFEANLARGSVLDIRVELSTLEGDREVAEIALARSLGLSRSYAPWTLTTTLPQPRSLSTARSAVVDQALSERLDAQVAELAVQAAEDEFVRQTQNVFPSIILGITGERTERRSLPGRNVPADTARASVAAGQLTAPSIQSRAQRDQARSQFIDALLGATVSMTLPIWDQNQAGIAKARYGVLQRRKELEDLYDEIAQAIGQAQSRVQALVAVTGLYDAEIQPNDTANIDGARALYETGHQNIIVLLDAQEALIDHQRRYVEALRDYATTIVDLELALGGPLGSLEDIPVDNTNEQSQP